MNFELSQKEIGHRIAKLRKIKGLSQEELAKKMPISRPSLAQIELGKRSLNILELQKLALILGFSLDSFMSEDFLTHQKFNHEKVEEQTQRVEERISVPHLKIDKFKNVLLYILEKCGGKPNVGETVLYKLLYFSDFNYYEIYEEQMTGAQYKKLPYGPVPQKLDSIINSMIEENKIQRVKREYHGYPQTKYLACEQANLTQMSAAEKEVIDQVIHTYSDWSASAISEYSHKDLPWTVTEFGEEINYELAFYREPPFSARNYGEEIEEA